MSTKQTTQNEQPDQEIVNASEYQEILNAAELTAKQAKNIFEFVPAIGSGETSKFGYIKDIETGLTILTIREFSLAAHNYAIGLCAKLNEHNSTFDAANDFINCPRFKYDRRNEGFIDDVEEYLYQFEAQNANN